MAGVAYWVNGYLKDKGMNPVDKKSDVVQKIYEWVQSEYDNGRITIISDAELEMKTREVMGLKN
jgi:hypothetical protein